LQNAISEYFFGTSLVLNNFIAVNYLVYTNEVIGNIMESYPIQFLVPYSLQQDVLLHYLKVSKDYLDAIHRFEKLKLSFNILLFFCIVFLQFPFFAHQENSENKFTNELQSNGIYRFYLAFMNSELDYFKFYKTIPTNEAYALLAKQLPGLKNNSSLRTITTQLMNPTKCGLDYYRKL
jgi:hypothetical protein